MGSGSSDVVDVGLVLGEVLRAREPFDGGGKTGADVVVKQEGKFAAQVIKTTFDQFGKYSIVKVYRGVLDVSVNLYNSNEEKAEKPTAPAMMKGKKTYPMEKLYAGDIGVVPKLQYTATGDTLCDAADPIIFDEIEFPKPAISLAVTAKKQGEDDKVITWTDLVGTIMSSVTRIVDMISAMLDRKSVV